MAFSKAACMKSGPLWPAAWAALPCWRAAAAQVQARGAGEFVHIGRAAQGACEQAALALGLVVVFGGKPAFKDVALVALQVKHSAQQRLTFRPERLGGSVSGWLVWASPSILRFLGMTQLAQDPGPGAGGPYGPAPERGGRQGLLGRFLGMIINSLPRTTKPEKIGRAHV